jgi:uncharacterized protein YecE (DUF72 family)
MTGRLHIGTSGWHYKHWVGLFYLEGVVPSEMLPIYLREFDTVEVNNTFYQLPAPSTFDTWRETHQRIFVSLLKQAGSSRI